MKHNQFQIDEEGLPDWEPVGIYDAPSTIITQIYDGEGSLGRAARTIFDESSLSPLERDSYVQRMKKNYGGNALSDFAIDIAMNPLVWLLVVTNPITTKQYQKAKGRMLGGAAQLGPIGRKVVGALRHMGLLGSALMNQHAGTSQTINHIAFRHGALQEALQRIGGKARGDMLRSVSSTLGKEILDFDHTRYTGEDRRKLGTLNRLLATMTGGFFSDDAKPVHLLVDRPRIARVVGSRGELHKILPPLPKGEGERVYIPGAKVVIDGQVHELLEKPLVVNDEASYVQGKKLLNQNYGFLTVQQVPNTIESRLPITRKQGLQLLHEEGFDVAHIESYVDAVHQQRRYLASLVLGSRKQGENHRGYLKADPDKILHSLQQFSENQGVRKNFSEAEKAAFHEIVGSLSENIAPDWVVGAIRAGTMTKTQLNNFVTEVYELQLNNPHYYPRILANQWFRHKNMAMRQEAYDVVGLHRGDAEESLKIRSAALLRERPDVILDQGDLEALREAFAGRLTPAQEYAWTKLEKRTRGYVEEQISKNTVASTLPLDFERAGRAYEQQMIGQAILYGENVPPHLLEMWKEVRRVPTEVLNESDRTTMPLTQINALRQETLKNLGVSNVTLENISFRDQSYPPEIKFTHAAQRWHHRLQGIRQEMGTSKDPRRIEQLERSRQDVNTELDFIRQYRNPLASTQDPKSIGELFKFLMGRENIQTQELIDGFILPRLFGGAQASHLVAMQALQLGRTTAKTFLDSSLGKSLREGGSRYGTSLVDIAERVAARPVYMQDAANLSRTTAGYLYSTHLSALMTGIYNGLQLFSWGATWVGADEILKAYPKALKQIAGYERARMKFGLHMDPVKKRELFRQHVPLSNYHGRDLTMLNDDFLSTLDGAIFSGRVHRKPGLARTVLMDLPLKFFQKMETVNRVVMAEASMSYNLKKMAATGIHHSPMELANEIETMQSMANFASQITTKPRLLSDPKSGLGGIMANPTFGMLLQFPIRFLTNALTGGMVYGGQRSIGLQKFGGPELFTVPAALSDLTRITGISAVIYEIGKNLMGTNLEPGLSVSAMTGLPNTMLQRWVPVPVDIVTKLAGGLIESDKEQLRQQVFRLLPAGLALSKALGAVPSMGGLGPAGLLQSQYADWKNPNPQGLIPVYKDDGTLQAFESPLTLVMRGVGFNPKTHQSPQEATKFLLANRQEIVGLKRQYKDAVLGNNMAQAAAIEGEYRKRFGMSMTVKPDEWDSAIRLREVTVGERMVDAMPVDMRPTYQQSLGNPMEAPMGLPEGGLYRGETAKQRDSIRQFSSGLLNPAVSSSDSSGSADANMPDFR